MPMLGSFRHFPSAGERKLPSNRGQITIMVNPWIEEAMGQILIKSFVYTDSSKGIALSIPYSSQECYELDTITAMVPPRFIC